MPRYNVEHDGQWACFSSVVDDFVTDFMPREEYLKWRDFQYGENYSELNPPEKCNMMSYEEAMETIEMKCRFEESLESEVEDADITNTKNVANNVANEKVQHLPEVGDIWEKAYATLHIIRKCGEKTYICLGQEHNTMSIFLWELMDFEFKAGTYLGKAKNPITSIFEVE